MEITEISFVRGFIRMCNDGWEQGWHERNGGNLSYRLKPEEVEEIRPFLNTNGEWKEIGTDVPKLSGEYFMVTGSGKYFRNVITFDSDVRAAVGGYDIFDATLPTLPVLEPGKLVLEVKFTELLPQLVRNILPPQAAEFTAVSKYVLCYEKTGYLNGFEYWYETQERKMI